MMELLLAGYGIKPQNSLALYRFENKENISMEWKDTVEASSFVCQGDGYFFTITEAEEYAYVYSYKRVDNQYRLTDQRKVDGGILCHIIYSKKNKVLFGACYGTGTVFSLQVNEGVFGEMLFIEEQVGADPKSYTRAHCVLLNYEENMLVVVNIALDDIYFYQISSGVPDLLQIVSLPKGTGPRHALFSQNEKLLYVITEYSNEVFVIQNDNDKSLISRISTLPKDYSGVSYCSTLCFSKNGSYLYAANRGADMITLFAVEKNGTLRKIDEYGCGGKYPRHMIVSRDGNYLVVCNQLSDNVTVFELDVEKGFIKSSAATIDFAAPSGVLEV